MYLIVIAWIYVVLMMSVAEATNSNGTVLGAIITFVLYGALPVALVVYLMGTPARNKALKKRDAERLAERNTSAGATLATSATSDLFEPDAGSHTPSGTEAITPGTSNSIPPVRKEL